MRIRLIAATAVGATALLSLTACGSSKKATSANPPATSSSAAAAAPSSAAAAPTGSTITIGTLGEFSSVNSSSLGSMPPVFQAWEKSVNDSGGLAGHPVKLIIKDLGNNQAGGLAAVKELIETDHVVAIVGEADGGDSAWASYAASKGVPVVGGLSEDIPFATNADFFPSGANTFAALIGLVQQAKTLGPKLGALYCAESPQCAQVPALFKGVGPVLGVTVPVVAKIAATAPDYTAVCQQLKDSGVASYTVGDAPAVTLHLATSCASQGLKAKLVSVDATIGNEFLKQTSLDGMLVVGVNDIYTDTSTDGGKAYAALLAKYIPGFGDKNNPNAFYAFAATQLFAKAIAGVTGDVTSDSIKTALYGLKDETLGGIAPKLNFVKDKPTLINCYFTAIQQGGTFVAQNGGQTTCAPDPIVQGILASLPKS